jgi:hypothetical protein
MKKHLLSPEHWRERAEETRAKADSFWTTEEEKHRLLRIALEYDQIAERAAEWGRSVELVERK